MLESPSGTPNTPICPPGLNCVLLSQAGPWLCTQYCDPLAPDCDEGLGCYWASTHFDCIFTAENIPTGEPCGYINDCAPGNLCADAAVLPSCVGSACCTKYCNLPDGDAGCVEQPGTACVPFFEQGMAPDGFEHVGVCVLPG